ncbi:hypothetical protein JM49_11620 [Pseudomonas chlororaphis subsp. aurantiaca]|nr:hypothetical protein JM49_11620 [Pseudomonas chlororaphis subsp. aurantiaca]
MMGSRLDFSVQQLLEQFFLMGCQVVLLVLCVKGEEPELGASGPPVINHPDPAAFALVPSLIDKADLAQATGSLDEIFGFGGFQQFKLQATKKLVVQVVLSMALEQG